MNNHNRKRPNRLDLARHCGKHGTCSNCNTNRNAITASLMLPPRAGSCSRHFSNPPRLIARHVELLIVTVPL
jgi:hypothetical protein